MAVLNENRFNKILKNTFKPKFKKHYICEICNKKINKNMIGSYWCDGVGNVTEPVCKLCNSIKKSLDAEFENKTTTEINSIIRSVLLESNQARKELEDESM